jgi:HEAT repeat protein
MCCVWLASFCLQPSLSGQTSQHRNDSSRDLVEQFNKTKNHWKQFEVAEKIVALNDGRVLQDLEPWLSSEDMQSRGNAAFIFAKLGDDRGFEVLRAILEDRFSKRAVFEMGDIGGPNLELQIRQDRWTAVGLFGDLKDPRAVPILLPLLDDKDVKEAVIMSLGKIGNKAAIPSLMQITDDTFHPFVRLLAVRALARLDAKEALPRLHAMLDDGSACFDLSVPLADAAEKAIDKLEQKPMQLPNQR